MALFFQGKYAESAAATRGSLVRKHELGDIVGTAYGLEALAMLALLAAAMRAHRMAHGGGGCPAGPVRQAARRQGHHGGIPPAGGEGGAGHAG